MSDLSLLSHEYRQASELSKSISHTLILLKTLHYGLPFDSQKITIEQITNTRKNFADFLDTLAKLFNSDEICNSVSMTKQISGTLIERLRKKHQGDLPYFLEDLHQVVGRLRQDSFKLTEEDFALMDQIAACADAESSNIFQRLMRQGRVGLIERILARVVI
jgi:hypothetical protein